MEKDKPWPTEIRLLAERTQLAVSFSDGAAFRIGAELLRVRSPSAEVQGHTPDQRVTVTGKRNVRIVDVEPIGSYAVRLVFDDGHHTGLYSWDFLRDCGERQDEIMAGYFAELAEKGLER